MVHSSIAQAVSQFRFLIIGHGNQLNGDAAVSPKVADMITSWHLPSIKSVSVEHLTPALVNDIVATDYVIFVEACGGESCARTVQINPITRSSQSAPIRQKEEPTRYDPHTLMTLTEQLYGRTPQAWLLQVPTENFDFGEGLSATAQRGYDSAVRTIEQFLKTYQEPAWAMALKS